MNTKHYRFMAAADDLGGGGGAAAPAPAPTPAAAPSPAATPAPAPAPSPAPSPTPAPAPPEPKGYWPDDWRAKFSKGDDKLLARVSRYGSPEDVAAALIAAQDRISKGELKPVLGKDATPEQISEWRQAHGIPEAVDKYDMADLKAPEADKPFIDQVLKAAHATNQTPDQVKATLKAYYDLREQVEAHMSNKDKEAETKGHDALRSEWGAEYRLHSNLIENLLAGSAAGGVKDSLMNGRLADGTLIKNSPEVQKLLLSLALIQNPLGTVVPGGGNPAQGIREEMDKIAKTRSENRGAYDKNVKMQERERELIGAAQRAGIMDERGNWKS